MYLSSIHLVRVNRYNYVEIYSWQEFLRPQSGEEFRFMLKNMLDSSVMRYARAHQLVVLILFKPAAVCEIDSTSGLRRGMSHVHLEIVECLGLKLPAKLSIVLNTSNVSAFIRSSDKSILSKMM